MAEEGYDFTVEIKKLPYLNAFVDLCGRKNKTYWKFIFN